MFSFDMPRSREAEPRPEPRRALDLPGVLERLATMSERPRFTFIVMNLIAVSELVRAGLVRRHCQGYRVDHHNRGAQREAVYTLLPEARAALAGG